MEFWCPLLLAASFLLAARTVHVPGCWLLSFLISPASKSSVLVLSSLVMFFSCIIQMSDYFLTIFLCHLCLIPHIWGGRCSSIFLSIFLLLFTFLFPIVFSPISIYTCPYLKFLGSCIWNYSLAWFLSHTFIHSLVACLFSLKTHATCYSGCHQAI